MPKIQINIDSPFDKGYGHWDIAPRVVTQPSADNVGYLLSYNPNTELYLILWDGAHVPMAHESSDFKVISGLMF